jgi:hypothetical protein
MKSTQNFMTTFEKYYSAANKPSGSVLAAIKKSCTTRKEDSIIFHDVHEVLADGRLLLKATHDLDEEMKKHRLDLPTSTWKNDEQAIIEFLACGREHGEQIVERILAPNSCPLPQRNGHRTSTNEQAAGRLFENSHKALGDECWGGFASKYLKLFKNAVAFTSPNSTKG